MSQHSQPELLRRLRTMDPYHFEQLIADIWQETQGWNTEVTQASRDWGADIVGRPPGHDQVTVVQAKRYAEDNPVSSNQIQQYAGLKAIDSEVAGVTVVTTGYFTDPALQAAKNAEVKCINGDELIQFIEQNDVHEIVEWYLAGKPEDWYE